jgi:hypothetical protein
LNHSSTRLAYLRFEKRFKLFLFGFFNLLAFVLFHHL